MKEIIHMFVSFLNNSFQSKFFSSIEQKGICEAVSLPDGDEIKCMVIKTFERFINEKGRFIVGIHINDVIKELCEVMVEHEVRFVNKIDF
jgi:hypothetical protein